VSDLELKEQNREYMLTQDVITNLAPLTSLKHDLNMNFEISRGFSEPGSTPKSLEGISI
jgi:hypothetical protein